MAKGGATHKRPKGSEGQPQERDAVRDLRQRLKQLQESVRQLAAQADSIAEELAQRPKVKVVLYPDGTGGYTVVAKALPGCIAEGDTREEALAEFREALQGYLQSTSGTFEMDEGGIEEEIEL
jgi:predicted RNase H-like HicB family nuclease